MSLDAEDPLVESAVFGREVENFLNTAIGKYLVERAENQADAANEQLKRVCSWRSRKIQELQNKIWVAESFQQWLADAIIDGHQALNILEGNE